MFVRRLGLLATVCATLVVGGCATAPPPAAPGVAEPGTAGSPGAAGAMTPTTSSPTAGSGSTPTATSGSAPVTPTAPTRRQLPGGGRTLLPGHRLVGFAGVPGSAAMGRLGIGSLDERAKELVRVGKPYADGRQVMPVLELIATIVQPQPGRDGKWRSRVSPQVVDDYLAAARRVGGILLIDIQPGRADFLDEVKSYERWLTQPDVGIALDPEWAMGPGQVPMRVFGHTTGTKIDEVAAYLASIVKNHDLPEKALVFHQLRVSIVSDQKAIRRHPGVVIIKSVDGIGNQAEKTKTWTSLTKKLPPAVNPGFKLFYEEDARHGPLMTPQQVLALRPKPDYVLYE
ncbi:MAG: hypothetical protein ABIQ53_14130 [Terracoccus sp.]